MTEKESAKDQGRKHLRIFKDADDFDRNNITPNIVQDSGEISKAVVVIDDDSKPSITDEELDRLMSDDNPKLKDNPWREVFTKHPNWKNMSYDERKAFVLDQINNIEDVEPEPYTDSQSSTSTIYTDKEGKPLSKADINSLGSSELVENLIKDKVIVIRDNKGNIYESRKNMVESFAKDVLEVLPSSHFIRMTREPEVDSVLEYLSRSGVDKETAVVYAKNKLMKDALAVALSSETPVEFYVVLRLFLPQNRTLAVSDDITEVCEQYNMGYLDAMSVLANRDISSKKNLAAFLKKTLKYHVDGIFKIYEMFTR